MATTVTRTSGGVRTRTPGGRTIGYQPALDGVRALSVLVVLLFHAEVAGFSGGYLGVSVFFTLSGFLITSLLVVEHGRTGEVAAGAFYARRARRLLPASIACILGIVVLSGVTDWFEGVSTLRRDVLGSLLQVANWVFLLGGGSYQELFDQAAGSVSPLEHYWSLAIEEQFYWLWPVAFIGITRLARTPWARRRAILLITLVAALAAPVIAAVWGADAAYWATPARAAEILIGASLAVVVAGRRIPPGVSALAPLGLLALAVAVTTFPAVGGPAYSGGLPLVAVASAALLLGLQAPGPLRGALSWGPLVWIGTISYGVYLYHWPVFVVLDEQRTGLDGVGLLALRFAVTFGLAELSFLLLERPIRHSRTLTMRPTLIGAGVATAAVAVVSLAVVPPDAGEYWTVGDDATDAAAIEVVDGPLAALTDSPVTTDGPSPSTPTVDDDGGAVDAGGQPAVEPEADAAAQVASEGDTAEDEVAEDVEPDRARSEPSVAGAVDDQPPPIPPLERPVRMLVVGDSTANALGTGLVNWAAVEPELAQVSLFALFGCGFVRAEALRFPERRAVNPGCWEWTDTKIPAKVAEVAPDVVALHTTTWDVQDLEFADGLIGSPTDPQVAERIRADLISLTERILDAGAGSVAWIRELPSDARWEDEVLFQEDPARHEVLYQVMDELAEKHPGRVHVIDLPAYVAERDLTDDREARPDGVHWTPEAATMLVTDYLGEQLIRTALDLEPR